MRIDDAAKEVRSVDQTWSVEWRAGVPSMNLSAEAFRGQQTSIEFGTGYALPSSCCRVGSIDTASLPRS
jgi:hypothetical protein